VTGFDRLAQVDPRCGGKKTTFAEAIALSATRKATGWLSRCTDDDEHLARRVVARPFVAV
jgi:hypothetical protein